MTDQLDDGQNNGSGVKWTIGLLGYLLEEVRRDMRTMLDKLDAKADASDVLALHKRVESLEEKEQARAAVSSYRSSTWKVVYGVLGAFASAAIVLSLLTSFHAIH